MKTNRLAVLLALSLPLAGATSAGAQAARCSGGSGSTDCYLEFDGGSCSGTFHNKPSIECTDGDPSCDSDGQANGVCTFSITACEFQSDVSGCTPQSLKKIMRIPGTKKVTLPPTGVSAPTCASATIIPVKLKGRMHNKASHKKIGLIAKASDGTKDKNIFFLGCTTGIVPPPGDMCPNNSAGGPRELTFMTLDHGTDLDTGVSGDSHNFPVIAGASLKLCLTGCDATTPTCTGNGATGEGSLNGPSFGPPLPLFAAGVPVCVINQFAASTVQGAVDIQMGTFDSTPTPVLLSSIVFSTPATEVCPRCGSGPLGSTATCSGGPNKGKSCTVEGTVPVRNPAAGIDTTYSLSHMCPPGPPEGSRTGAIPISLPITTGTPSPTLMGSKPCPGQLADDSCPTHGAGAACTVDCNGQADVKGGFNQWCCSSSDHQPCFPTAANSGEPNHAIVRTGTPVPPAPVFPDPTYPKTATEVKSVATFCIASSHSSVIDQVSGLPGPGAVTFNSMVTVTGNAP